MLDYKKLKLPDKHGIYMFKNEKGDILYVGKALNIKHRVSSYFTKGLELGSRTKMMLSQATTVDYVVVENELEALLLEANLIKRYMPRYNVRFTDGKAYPFIKITVQDKYPKVLQARRVDDLQALFFGPYASVGIMRSVFRIIRRVFPYQSVMNHQKRPCLYYHLGLCPCPTVFDSEAMKKVYRKNIRYLIKFLQGKKQDVIKGLIKDMEQVARKERFEDAAKIKKQIEQTQLITSPMHRPIEYLENPNLVSDQQQKELSELRRVLGENGLNVQNLDRIECYDISNIQGKQATGSMVVLTNGEIDKSQYRKFKVKILGRPNDVAMMREVIRRRVRHQDWGAPNLVVVDGGRGQVYGVIEELRDLEYNQYTGIPVIGLAKRLEEIVIPYNENFKMVRLPLNSPAINTLRRVRDEAHRFAIQYHKKLRLRQLLPFGV